MRRTWAPIRIEERLISPLGAVVFVISVSALCALVITERAWLPLYGAATLLVVGVVWPFAGVCGLHAELSFDRPRVRECEPIEGSLRIRNRSFWGAVQTSVQEVGGATFIDAESVSPGMAVIEHVPARQMVERKLRLPAAARGFYPRQVPQLANGFPFGLVTARRRIGVPRRAIVWPRSFPLCLPTRLLRGGADGQEYLVDRSGNQGETIGVRPFRQGDSPRRIHWPQTSRQGRTVVREQQRRISARVLITLDPELSKPGSIGHLESREWAIRVASSIFESWWAIGTYVELCLSEGVARYSSKTEQSRTQALDALATFDEMPAPSDHTHRTMQLSPAQYDLHVIIRTGSAPANSEAASGDCRSEWNIVVATPDSNGLATSRSGSPIQRRPSGRVHTDFLAGDDSLPSVLAALCRELADG